MLAGLEEGRHACSLCQDHHVIPWPRAPGLSGLRAEQSRAEQSRAEQSRAEQKSNASLLSSCPAPLSIPPGQHQPGGSALQVGLAAVSIALVGIFVLANGSSDLAYMLSPSPAQQAQQGRSVELSEDTRKDLERQLAVQQGQLEASPDSIEALEGVAVINARLGNFKVGGHPKWWPGFKAFLSWPGMRCARLFVLGWCLQGKAGMWWQAGVAGEMMHSAGG